MHRIGTTGAINGFRLWLCRSGPDGRMRAGLRTFAGATAGRGADIVTMGARMGRRCAQVRLGHFFLRPGAA